MFLSSQKSGGASGAIARASQTDLVTKGDLNKALSETKVEIIKLVSGHIGFQTLIMIGTVLALVHQ